MKQTNLYILIITLLLSVKIYGCSVLFYVDAKTGHVYAVNNEDYWLDTKSYIQIEPKTKKEFARLWYGWGNFAQGGINEYGLFFDAAITPDQPQLKGYHNPKDNLGDRLLASCKTVEDAISFLEKEKIALINSHILFGDKSGNAVIIEWLNGQKILHYIKDNRLIMTNYLLSNPNAGNYPCYRYDSIDRRLTELESSNQDITLNKIGNTVGQAVQVPQKAPNGKELGTLYTTFINISTGQFVLSHKLSNTNIVQLDLNEEFKGKKRKRINLKDKI